MDADDANETDRTEMRVILEGATSGPAGSSFRKEFAIEALTDIDGRFALVDEDGEPRLLPTADEFAGISSPEASHD